MSLTVPCKVTDGIRTGTAIYDNGVTSNTTPSVIVLYADSTYNEQPRGNLTVVTAGGFLVGTGPGN